MNAVTTTALAMIERLAQESERIYELERGQAYGRGFGADFGILKGRSNLLDVASELRAIVDRERTRVAAASEAR